MAKMLPCLCVLLTICGSSLAIINMQITPRQVVDTADLVMAGTLARDGDSWTLRVDDAIKGKGPASFTFDLTKCNKDQIEPIRALLTENTSRPAVLITSPDRPLGSLHVGGTWLEVSRSGNGWHVLANAPHMTGTFSGGTDMLSRMLTYLAQHPTATVPVTAGVKWTDNVIAGKVPDGSALEAIEWPANGKPAIFVTSSKGDRLLAPKDGTNAFDDVTAAAGLTSASLQYAFVDINGDGIADLVSYDGSAINLFLGGKSFKAAGASWSFKIQDCIGLAACSLDGTPGVLVSRRGAPMLLVAQKDGWNQIDLPKFAGNIGKVSPCIVADLDNDGFVDVLQPGETAGLLWRGAAQGFAAPVKSAVCTGGGIARHTVADFNEDGFADIFLAGPEKNGLFENDGKGGFVDVMRFAGSLSSKCAPGASAVMAMDLNHDGLPDLCLGYANGELLYHFNRGFRSMGEEREVRLPGAEPQQGRVNLGLQSFAVADFNGENSADLAILQSDGTVRVYYNDRVDAPALMMRLPKGVVGPVTVSCWTDEPIPSFTGLAIVCGHAPGAYLPVHNKGVVKLRYRFPGGAAATLPVTVDDGTKEALLEAQGGN